MSYLTRLPEYAEIEDVRKDYPTIGDDFEFIAVLLAMRLQAERARVERTKDDVRFYREMWLGPSVSSDV
jgi:hypothetical protein